MHSVLVRAQNVFGFFTTVAFTTAIFTALSVLLTPQNPSASIELRNVQVYAREYPILSESADTHSTESRGVLITTRQRRKSMHTSSSISTPVSRLCQTTEISPNTKPCLDSNHAQISPPCSIGTQNNYSCGSQPHIPLPTPPLMLHHRKP